MHFCCAKSLNDYTCVRLKELYMKHYNNIQPNLIMPYVLSHSVPPPPLHPHTLTYTQSHNPSRPPLSLPVSLHLPSLQNHRSASEDVSSKINIKSSTASNACKRGRVCVNYAVCVCFLGILTCECCGYLMCEYCGYISV